MAYLERLRILLGITESVRAKGAQRVMNSVLLAWQAYLLDLLVLDSHLHPRRACTERFDPQAETLLLADGISQWDTYQGKRRVEQRDHNVRHSQVDSEKAGG